MPGAIANVCVGRASVYAVTSGLQSVWCLSSGCAHAVATQSGWLHGVSGYAGWFCKAGEVDAPKVDCGARVWGSEAQNGLRGASGQIETAHAVCAGLAAKAPLISQVVCAGLAQTRQTYLRVVLFNLWKR